MICRFLRAAAAAAAVIMAFSSLSCKRPSPAPPDTETVGVKDAGRTIVPVNQVVAPIGIQVPLPGLRPQALALSPDGKLLAVSGKTHELVIIDPAAGAVRQRVAFPAEEQNAPPPEAPSASILEHDEKAQLSYTGLLFAPDGGRIYLSNVNGSIKVFSVGANGEVAPSHTIPLPPANAPRRAEEIPAGLALTDDGRLLFVCGNLSNRLLEVDTTTGAVLRTTDVGVAPFAVVLASGKAYVSNWGGRRPGPGDLTGPAGRGTEVRVDPVNHIASEGSISVVDLSSGKVRAEILVQLHASALALSPDGRYLVCANAASDNVSVIDTTSDTFGPSRARPTSSERPRTPWPSLPMERFFMSPTALKTPSPSSSSRHAGKSRVSRGSSPSAGFRELSRSTLAAGLSWWRTSRDTPSNPRPIRQPDLRASTLISTTARSRSSPCPGKKSCERCPPPPTTTIAASGSRKR
jgi:DNA-binding beta-propeller fold protein YncE